MSLLRSTTFIFTAVLLCACEGTSPSTIPPAPPHQCPDANPGPITIKIKYGNSPQPINVPQDPQHAEEGDVLKFMLLGKAGVLVSTSGKDAAAGWLNGSGRKKDSKPGTEIFYVCVPRDLFEDDPKEVLTKKYKYNVDAIKGAETWPQLDPIVIIDRL